jgi:hypothetical protein
MFVGDRPDREKQLDELGFVWNDLERRWEVGKQALAMYKRMSRTMEVPYTFAVPESKIWPKEMWDMKSSGKR